MFSTIIGFLSFSLPGEKKSGGLGGNTIAENALNREFGSCGLIVAHDNPRPFKRTALTASENSDVKLTVSKPGPVGATAAFHVLSSISFIC
jgi:hypothetical protein